MDYSANGFKVKTLKCTYKVFPSEMLKCQKEKRVKILDSNGKDYSHSSPLASTDTEVAMI